VSKQLLVVEDAPEVVALLLLTLEPARFVVTVADSLAKGRVAAQASPGPDLVILDVDLPDGSGLDLCRELKAARPRLPVMALKIGALARSRREALAAGADVFLPQPAEQLEFVAGMTTLVNRAAADGPARGPNGA
jgi:DNA-binding response OmpR family regulator